MGIFRIALKNLKRRPARSAAIFTGVAALSAVLCSLTVIYVSAGRSLDKARGRLGADAVVVPEGWKEETSGILLSGAPSEFYMPGGVAERIRGVEGVREAAPQLFIVSAPLSCCTVSDTMLVGFEPREDFTVTPWLRERLGRELSWDEVIAGADIKAGEGGKITFYGSEFRIAGKLEPTGMRFIDSSVFIPMAGARRMIGVSAGQARRALGVRPDEISSVLIRFSDGYKAEEAALRIEYAVPGVRVVLSNDIIREAGRNLSVPLGSVAAAAALQWCASLFMTAVLFSLSISERTREIGLLMAVGARARDVRNMFLYEAAVLSASGGLVGATAGVFLVVTFKDLVRAFFGVPFLLPQAGGLALLALAVALFATASGLAVTLYPVIKSSKKPPFEAIAAS